MTTKQETKRVMVPWTDEQVADLKKAVADGRTHKEAFEKIAFLTGRRADAVAMKYYKMRGPVRSKKPAVRASAKKKSIVAYKPSPNSTIDLKSLTIEQLITIAEGIQHQLKSRRAEMDVTM